MKKRKEFKHLTANDRDRIHALYGHGHTKKVIAEVLGVHKSTITRELERYGRTTWRYSAAQAQKHADEKRSHSKRPGMKIAENPDLRRYIIRELKKLRSPDEISGRMKREGRIPRVGLQVALQRRRQTLLPVSLHTAYTEEAPEPVGQESAYTRPDTAQIQAPYTGTGTR